MALPGLLYENQGSNPNSPTHCNNWNIEKSEKEKERGLAALRADKFVHSCGKFANALTSYWDWQGLVTKTYA